MPRIRTSSSNHLYTYIKAFQEAIDVNTMAITSYTTELGHLALTRKASEFKSASDGTSFIEPTKPGKAPSPPAHITTRTSTATLATDPTAIAETTDPFLAHEAIHLFSE